MWICRACRSHLIARNSNNSNHKRFLSNDSRLFKVSEEVQQAVAEKRPVVALESTIYTHGFPYPDNLSLASKLESLVRINGGVPATIGVLDGVARVGLGADELVRLVSSAGSAGTLKVSRRDLGFALGLKDVDGKSYNGGTTVAGTMILAHLAGLKVFATGGLGGVHRGVEQTMDVSADLTELGRTPIAVISSGCKSFLDIPKTLEYLETQGVAVATFADGRTGNVDFPAFWSRESGARSPMTLHDEIAAARVVHAHHALGLQSGLVFANPIPELHSIPYREMKAAIGQAIEAAHAAGATGAASTPYILAKIKELTRNESVAANKALVESNVVRGTKVAVALSQIEKSETNEKDVEEQLGDVMVGPAAINYTSDGIPQSLAVTAEKEAKELNSAQTRQESTNESISDIFVAGSLAIDFACDYKHLPGSSSHLPEMHTSNPATISQSLGGVGHNVARAAHLMGGNVRLCSAVGDDLTGKAALDALAAAEMTCSGIKILPRESGSRTAQYVAVNDSKKDLVLAMADMSILEKGTGEEAGISSTFEDLWMPQLRESRPSVLAVDGNWPPEYLSRWLQAGREIDARIVFEPVSNVKAARLFQLPNSQLLSVFPKPSVHIATPNAHELLAMYMAARQRGVFDRKDWWEIIDALGLPDTGARTQLAFATNPELVDHGVPQQSIQLLPFIPTICTKLGHEGVLLTQLIPAHDERLSSKEHAPHILSRCRNATEDTIGVGGIYMRLFPAAEVKAEDVVSVNGVGDTFAGTLIAGLAKRGPAARVEDLVDLAQRAAVLTLKSEEAVSTGLGTLRILL